MAFTAPGGPVRISGTGNIAPKLGAQMQEASRAVDHAKALAIQEKLLPLHSVLFVEASPGPVKYAAELLGICQSDLRLPMAPPSKETQAKVKAAVKALGLQGPKASKSAKAKPKKKK